MKKALYILLLAAECIVGLLLMGLVYSNIGWPVCLLILAVVAVLLVLLLRRYRKEQDAAARSRLRRRIALVLLIPIALGVLLAAYVVISLMLYFG